MQVKRVWYVVLGAVLLVWVGSGVLSAATKEAPEIGTRELKQMLDTKKDLLLVNVLPPIFFRSGYIPGSVNIPLGRLKTSPLLPKDKNKLIVFYCMGRKCILSPHAGEMALEMGYRNVRVFREGLPGWVRAGYPLKSDVRYPRINIPALSPKVLYDMLEKGGVFLLDTRADTKDFPEHIKGSVHIDLEEIQNHLDRLPKDKKIVLIDLRGKTSLLTGRYLVSEGFTNVARLQGGIAAWKAAGLPLE